MFENEENETKKVHPLSLDDGATQGCTSLHVYRTMSILSIEF